MDLLYNAIQRLTVGFNRELKKICRAIEDRQKKSEGRMRSIEERTEITDFAVGQTSSKITELENANYRLNDDLPLN